ncbi:hypothetical protein [Streptomyces sp. Je 1-332]|uniref:hypothetical protein n=1 Tax=Streptomyces sp. Je 1-332 TaxID=3231270 RepID=UPI003458AE71
MADLRRNAVRALTPALAVAALAAVASCSGAPDEDIPRRICETNISPEITRPLIGRAGAFDEYSRLDNKGAHTAPCVLLLDEKAVMRFRFAWSSDRVDPMKYAESTLSVSNLTEPRRTEGRYRSVVGNEGAMSTVACKKAGESYFTLTMKLPEAPTSDSQLRGDIEEFMTAYMNATVKKLGCRGK